MVYSAKSIIKDVNGKAVPQYWNNRNVIIGGLKCYMK